MLVFLLNNKRHLTRLFYVSFTMREMGSLLFPLFLSSSSFFNVAELDVLVVGVGRASSLVVGVIVVGCWI
jgi:hypothetical protein